MQFLLITTSQSGKMIIQRLSVLSSSLFFIDRKSIVEFPNHKKEGKKPRISQAS